jgi:hypothetical protein
MVEAADDQHGPVAARPSEKRISMITASQCRAARALIDWSIFQLSEASGVSIDEISAFEVGTKTPDAPVNLALERALLQGGAMFLMSTKTRGVGVRLKFSPLIVKRIDVWENEGGPPGEDDIKQ